MNPNDVKVYFRKDVQPHDGTFVAVHLYPMFVQIAYDDGQTAMYPYSSIEKIVAPTGKVRHG